MRAVDGAGAATAGQVGDMASPHWLFDADEVTSRLQAAGVAVDRVEPTYLREKPGENVVVGLRLVAGEVVTPGYLRWCVDAQRASAEWTKALALAPVDTTIGPGAQRVGDRAVLRVFPNDATLRRARWFFTPRKLKRSLADLDHGGRVLSGSGTSVTLLAYKPERRAVARVDLGYRDGSGAAVILRYTAGPAAGRLAATAAHLAGHGVSTARPIARLEGGRVTIDELLPGLDLRAAAAASTDDATRAAVAAAVADQVATLHGCPPPAVAPVRRRDDELARCSTALRWLDGHGDVDAGLATAVWERLVDCAATLSPERMALIHGDLHDRNVLVEVPADGGDASASLIDLDRVAVGDPAIDLGYLMAHGIAGAIRRLDGGVVHDVVARIVTDLADRRRVEPSSLRLHTGIGLVEAALTAARHLEGARSPDLVARLLEAALVRLPDRSHPS